MKASNLAGVQNTKNHYVPNRILSQSQSQSQSLKDNTEQKIYDKKKNRTLTASTVWDSQHKQIQLLTKAKKGKQTGTFIQELDNNKIHVPKVSRLSKSEAGEQSNILAVSPSCEGRNLSTLSGPMDAYELIQIVGKGAFGKVFKVSEDLSLFGLKSES